MAGRLTIDSLSRDYLAKLIDLTMIMEVGSDDKLRAMALSDALYELGLVRDIDTGIPFDRIYFKFRNLKNITTITYSTSIKPNSGSVILTGNSAGWEGIYKTRWREIDIHTFDNTLQGVYNKLFKLVNMQKTEHAKIADGLDFFIDSMPPPSANQEF